MGRGESEISVRKSGPLRFTANMSYPQSYHQGYPPQQGYSQQPQYDQQQQQAYGGQQLQGYPPPQQHAPPETTDSGSYQNIHYTIKHRNTNSTSSRCRSLMTVK